MEQLEVWFHARFKQCQDSVVPLPHAREFLQFCRARDLRTFVLSSVHPDHFATQAEVAAFSEFIDEAFVGVWDKREKIHSILRTTRLARRGNAFHRRHAARHRDGAPRRRAFLRGADGL